MFNKTKPILLFPLIIALSFIIGGSALAVCPVCTVAVGACLGLSRWLGIDDLITGLWVGGLTASLILWTIAWFDKKNWRFKFRKILITFIYYLMIFIPLFYSGLIGHPYNKIYGIDKLLFSSIIGSIFFFLGAKSYDYFKNKNDGKAIFPFQKVVMPIAPLVIFSIIFYYLTC